MKKVLATVMILLITATLALLPAGAVAQAGDKSSSVSVGVTITNGEIVLANEKITVTDIDNDGTLTLNDALYCAHEQKYTGGAAAGYGSEPTSMGISLTKLWGIDNGGAYGYHIFGKSTYGLADKIYDGDYITAYVYKDTSTYCDIYCYFDAVERKAVAGEEISLTLTAEGYDANWQTVYYPLKDAVIYVDGKATETLTDSDGKCVLKIDAAGKHTVSAKSKDTGKILVPPITVIDVTAKNPYTGDGSIVFIAVGLLSLSVFCLAVTVYGRKIIINEK